MSELSGGLDLTEAPVASGVGRQAGCEDDDYADGGRRL